jgi:Sec-independent protein secretion pathway component TatC
MWMLFELGIVAGRMIRKKQLEEEMEEQNQQAN